MLAAVGHQMASRKGVAATMFSALAKANINIRSGCVHNLWALSETLSCFHMPTHYLNLQGAVHGWSCPWQQAKQGA